MPDSMDNGHKESHDHRTKSYSDIANDINKPTAVRAYGYCG